MAKRQRSPVVLVRGPAATYEFDAQTGGLRRMAAGAGQRHLCGAPRGNWRMVVRSEGKEKSVGPADMGRLSFQPDRKGKSLVLTWRSPRVRELPSGFEVVVKWSVEDGLLKGELAYSGLNGASSVKEIQFPVIEFAAQPDDALVFPSSMGRRIQVRDADKLYFRNKEQMCRLELQYLGHCAMQFSLYLSGGHGLYFDTRDALGFIKRYSFARDTRKTITYAATHLLPVTSGGPAAYAIPYPVTVGIYAGADWLHGAFIYRGWAMRQPWARSALARRNKETSRRVREQALWVWNRGSIEDTVVPAEMLARKLQLPVALDWYWWHQHPYDTGYPNYLPPREGARRFKQAVARLKKQNIMPQVYINGVLWDADDPSWKNGGRQGVILNENGEEEKTVFSAYMKQEHALGRMCGSAYEFQKRIRALAKNIQRLGIEGLYLDCIGASAGLPCYHPGHDHQPGGGTYMVQGYRRLLQSVRKQSPGLVLCSEGCGEVYMDLLDAGIQLDASSERVWGRPLSMHPVPLLSAVYHSCWTAFGNYAFPDGIPPYDPLWPPEGKWKKEADWRRQCPDQFFVEVARGIVWGLQPTVANFRKQHAEAPEFAAEREFLIEAARGYHAHRAFLLDGEMLTPGRLTVASRKVKFLTRMVYTKEHEQSIVQKNLPAILHSCWRAPNGARLLVLVNPTAQPASYRYQREEFGLQGCLEGRRFLFVQF